MPKTKPSDDVRYLAAAAVVMFALHRYAWHLKYKNQK
jgi:hypothetical protein